MEIKFKEKYEYNSGEADPCICELTLYLPVDENKKLHPLLRKKEYIFGLTLTENWGRYDKERNMRFTKLFIWAKNWKELFSKIIDEINTTQLALKKIKKENEFLKNTKPSQHEITIKL